MDGRARVLEDVTGAEAAGALRLLAERYPQYRERPPAGPVIALDLEHITGWST